MSLTLMPKGVEHFSTSVQSWSAFEVSLTLMPKGVEHFVVPDELGVVDASVADVDAERR